MTDFLDSVVGYSSLFTEKKLINVDGIRFWFKQKGIVIIEPQAYHEAVVLSSGIHGDETAPIELIDQLFDNIWNGRCKPTVKLMLIIANTNAIKNARRYMNENLNRLFCERNDTANEERVLANLLQEEVTAFFSNCGSKIKKWHLDLHCSIRESHYPHFALIPASNQKKDLRQLLHFLNLAGIEALVLSQMPSSTFSWWSSEIFGALSATLELGKLRLLYQNDLHQFTKFRNALDSLLTASISSDRFEMNLYKVSRTIHKRTSQFCFSFSDEVKNFTFFSSDKELAFDSCVIRAKEDGESVLFPNKHVKIGQRACLLLVPHQIDMNSPVYPLFNDK